MLLGMFGDDPMHAARRGRQPASAEAPRGARGRRRARRARVAPAATIYQFWGYRFDFKEGDGKKPKKVYERLLDEIPLSLTEQRERLLDLVDGIVGAMVEECCPPKKPPEDWDWKGITSGFIEHFGSEAAEKFEHLHDPEQLAHELYDAGREGMLDEKEKEIGTELFLARLPPLLPRGDRPAVGRAPHEHGAPARRHRPARLRPARPEAGVQEGGLRHLRRR